MTQQKSKPLNRPERDFLFAYFSRIIYDWPVGAVRRGSVIAHL